MPTALIGMPLLPISLVFLVTNLYALEIPIKYTSNKKEATDEKLIQTFNLEVIVTLF